MKDFIAKLKSVFWFDELDAQRNEIVFFGRNHNYGAFALRKSYDEHLLKAFGATTLFILALVLLPFILQGKERESNIIVCPMDDFHEVDIITPIVEKQTVQKQIKTIPPKGNEFKVPNITKEKEQQNVIDDLAEDIIKPYISGDEYGEEQTLAFVPMFSGEGEEETFNNQTQEQEEEVVKDIKPLTFAQVMPEFKGGETALRTFLAEHLKYPRRALETGTEGRLHISFVVNTDGSISKIKIVKGALGFGCEEAALQVIEKMPVWNPGQQNGTKVPVQITIPINFAIQP